MTNLTKMEKIGKVLLNIADIGVDSMRNQANLRSRDRKISEEYRERYTELADGLGNIKDTISEYKNRIGQSIDQADSFGEYNNYSEENDNQDYIKNFNQCLEQKQESKCYENIEKAYIQKQSALLTNDIVCDDVDEWDRKWIGLGKLKDFSSSDCSLLGVGIVKLSLPDSSVYINRAIELNNGGVLSKIKSLQELRINKNSKEYAKIKQYIADCDLSVIVVGDDLRAVDISKKIEKKFLLKYKLKLM